MAEGGADGGRWALPLVDDDGETAVGDEPSRSGVGDGRCGARACGGTSAGTAGLHSSAGARSQVIGADMPVCGSLTKSSRRSLARRVDATGAPIRPRLGKGSVHDSIPLKLEPAPRSAQAPGGTVPAAREPRSRIS